MGSNMSPAIQTIFTAHSFETQSTQSQDILMETRPKGPVKYTGRYRFSINLSPLAGECL